MSVDWTKPLEAVRKSDGLIVPVTHNQGFFTHECPNSYETNLSWNEDGSDVCGYDKWFVRNVITPEWATEEARKILTEADPRGYPTTNRIADWVVAELAKLIAKHEPQPVDPDLIEARKLLAEADPDKGYQYLSGERDGYPSTVATLAGIRRGRELANV